MNNKIAVITGASRGIGRSIALHLAASGVDVIGTYVSNETEADALVEAISERGARGRVFALDVTDMQHLNAFAETLERSLRDDFGRDRFDFLVNNAGFGLNRPFKDVSEEQFDALASVNLKAPFFVTQKLLPFMADGGSILNVSSGLARFTVPGNSAYAAMKGGVEVLTRYLARELGERNITANVIAPGVVASDFNGGAVRDNPELRARAATQIALGRVGQPDDIGAAAASLLTSSGHWINGTRIEISGGQNL